MLRGEYLSDNGAPCRKCGSTCVVYTVGRDYRERPYVVRFCVCCHHRTKPELLPDIGDTARDLSAWDRLTAAPTCACPLVWTGHGEPHVDPKRVNPDCKVHG